MGHYAVARGTSVAIACAVSYWKLNDFRHGKRIIFSCKGRCCNIPIHIDTPRGKYSICMDTSSCSTICKLRGVFPLDKHPKFAELNSRGVVQVTTGYKRKPHRFGMKPAKQNWGRAFKLMHYERSGGVRARGRT